MILALEDHLVEGDVGEVGALNELIDAQLGGSQEEPFGKIECIRRHNHREVLEPSGDQCLLVECREVGCSREDEIWLQLGLGVFVNETVVLSVIKEEELLARQ